MLYDREDRGGVTIHLFAGGQYSGSLTSPDTTTPGGLTEFRNAG